MNRAATEAGPLSKRYLLSSAYPLHPSADDSILFTAMQLRHIALTILVPVAVFGGYFLTPTAGGVMADAWDGFVGPFLITYWIGLGFTNMWEIAKAELKDFSPRMAIVTVVLVIFILLSTLGGPAALLDDPWLFGVVIAPGIDLILPHLRRQQPILGEPPDAHA
jgi:hypothetical protein